MSSALCLAFTCIRLVVFKVWVLDQPHQYHRTTLRGWGPVVYGLRRPVGQFWSSSFNPQHNLVGQMLQWL